MPNTNPELKQHRERLGLSLRAAAKKLGIAHSYLADIENGHREISTNVANAMGEVYGHKPHTHEWKCECGVTCGA